ncbi:hypothetical protein Tco_1161773, partial [Tanacetum coccineum]
LELADENSLDDKETSEGYEDKCFSYGSVTRLVQSRKSAYFVHVHYILPGFSSKKSIVEAKLSSRGNASVAGMSQTWSSESRLSPYSKYWLWTKGIAPYLVCRLLLFTSCADDCSLLPETLLYLLRRHCSLPPDETLLHLLRRHCSLPPEETLLHLMRRHWSLPPEETLLHLIRRHCSLPPEKTLLYLVRRHCSLPHEETLLHLMRRHCSLPPEETLLLLPRRHCSIIIASEPEVTFVNPTTPADRSNIECFVLGMLIVIVFPKVSGVDHTSSCPPV